MEFSKVLKERRSIRKYLDKDISTDVLKEIIEEVRFSPSWKNTQPTRFVVVKDKALKDDIAKKCTNGFIYNEKTITRCNSLVVVCIKKDTMDNDDLTNEEKTKWLNFDAGIATQSLCLSCYNKGISSVILGIFDEEKINKALSIPADLTCAALVALGYSDVLNDAPKRLEVEDLLTIK